MFERLDALVKRCEELDKLLASPNVLGQPALLKKYSKERAELAEIVALYQDYREVEQAILENKQLINADDEILRELAREELAELAPKKESSEKQLKILLLPKDPNDDKNIFLEIRAGTGGDEAALFSADLFRMYLRYAERHRFRVEIMSQSESASGGFKEIIALIEGKGAYSRLKHEKGVHRVQRVPATEAQGRIHTSTVTVAVLAEAKEVDVKIDPEEIRVDVFRSSGPGGQSVNTTDSAVRITHLPSGVVVTCQDEKSQHKNKAKALKVLRARLLERLENERESEIAANRRLQVGTGERSEKIRTYNFSQNRLTDHRIGLTLYKLEEVLSGGLDEIIEALSAHYQVEALKEVAH
ncbi:MAG: peptide chain release factor 1 [Thermodesulfobacteriota bacterium]